jgi:hypothetical protein
MHIAPNAGTPKGAAPALRLSRLTHSFGFTEGVIHRSHPKLPHFMALFSQQNIFTFSAQKSHVKSRNHPKIRQPPHNISPKYILVTSNPLHLKQ